MIVFQACVDSSKNVLGVCCVDLAVLLSGAGRPVRQDDVFSLSSNVDMLVPKTSSARQVSEEPPFVIININADNADINGDVTNNKRVNTNVATRRPNTTRRPRPRPTLPDDFLSDNPFINLPTLDDSSGLTPGDVMAILNMMNNNRVVNTNNNVNSNGVVSDQVFTTCPAATLCVDRSRCDFNGVITTSSVSLNPRLASMQVALNVRMYSTQSQLIQDI